MSDENLNAYLDGELLEDERGKLELGTKYKELKKLDAELRDAYGDSAAIAEEVVARFKLPRRRNAVWFLVPLAAAAGLLVGVFLKKPTQTPSPRDPVLGVITMATGALEVDVGSLLTADAVVRTPEGTRCSLSLTDGSELRLDRGTEIRLVGRRNVEVLSGRIWSRVSPGAPFRVRARETEVSVLGTELGVRILPEYTTVQLFSGYARVESKGKSTELFGGQQIRVPRDGPTVKLHVDTVLATGWMLELYARAGPHEKELADRINEYIVAMGRLKAVGMEEKRIVKDLGPICRVPLARYLVSEQAKYELEPRRKAARVLVFIGDGSVAGELANALSDPDEEVRFSAGQALNRISEGAICSIPSMCRSVGPETDAMAKKAREWAARQER